MINVEKVSTIDDAIRRGRFSDYLLRGASFSVYSMEDNIDYLLSGGDDTRLSVKAHLVDMYEYASIVKTDVIRDKLTVLLNKLQSSMSLYDSVLFKNIMSGIYELEEGDCVPFRHKVCPSCGHILFIEDYLYRKLERNEIQCHWCTSNISLVKPFIQNYKNLLTELSEYVVYAPYLNHRDTSYGRIEFFIDGPVRGLRLIDVPFTKLIPEYDPAEHLFSGIWHVLEYERNPCFCKTPSPSFARSGSESEMCELYYSRIMMHIAHHMHGYPSSATISKYYRRMNRQGYEGV